MDHRPVKIGHDRLYVLLELGKTVGPAVDRALEQTPARGAQADLFDAALARLPALLRAVSSVGFGLARGEEKTLRGIRRRTIRSATWKQLGAAAKSLDLTRPQLLRALLRLHLSLEPEPAESRAPARRPSPKSPDVK